MVRRMPSDIEPSDIEPSDIEPAQTRDQALKVLRRQVTGARLAGSYDDFYQGEPAPLSDVTTALWGASP